MKMNDVEQAILSLIDDLVSAQVIRKETILAALDRDCSTNTNHILNEQAEERLIENRKILRKLFKCKAITNTNFCNWMRNNGISGVSPKETLNLCLENGVFSYTTSRGNRTYYVKNDITNPPNSSMIVRYDD